MNAHSYPNIEPSVFGEYVGYGGGSVWAIWRHGRVWRANERGGIRRLRGDTLGELSALLSGLPVRDAVPA